MRDAVLRRYRPQRLEYSPLQRWNHRDMAIMTPSLAVVIPTFNRARTIARAVDSVLSDINADVELVVVDDHSSDATATVLGRFADARLTFMQCDQHANANVARNIGVARTSAPIVAFLDSDDEFLPSRINRLIRFFATSPSVDAVLDGFQVERNGIKRTYACRACVRTGDSLTKLLVSHAIPLTNSAIAIRRRVLDEIGHFDEALSRHQDRDLLLRLAPMHRLAIGTGSDVIKHQSHDSISRDPVGYIEGLDTLVGKHPVFLSSEFSAVLGYLIARPFLHEVQGGRLLSAAGIIKSLLLSENLPHNISTALKNYLAGRRARRAAEAEFLQAQIGTVDTIRIRPGVGGKFDV